MSPQLADFNSVSTANTFLNLVSQTLDDVSFIYNATTNLLTLQIDSSKADVSEQYIEGEYVWVGKLEETDPGSNILDISDTKFWQVDSINISQNTVSLIIPEEDESIIDGTAYPPTGNLTVLLSSTSMVDLMHYYKRV